MLDYQTWNAIEWALYYRWCRSVSLSGRSFLVVGLVPKPISDRYWAIRKTRFQQWQAWEKVRHFPAPWETR
jgi:hypothetical protein